MALISNVPFQRSMLAIGQAFISTDWRRWLQELKDAIDLSPRRIAPVATLSGQAGAVGPTPLETPSLSSGLYRVSWLLRVTQAATTSGSVQLSALATIDGVLTQQSGAALTSNVVGAVQSGSVVVAVDPGTDISYQVAYASVGATVLQYAVDVHVEVLA